MLKLISYIKEIYSEKEPLNIQILLTSFFIFIVLLAFIALTSIRVVPTASMHPAIEPGDVIFNNKIPQLIVYDKITYDRNDIVSFCIDSKKFLLYCDGDTYIKRIVGIPHEKVQLIDGKLYINDELTDLNIDFIEDELTTEPITLKEGEYYVLGDNRSDSIDSRVLGGIHVTKILGKSYNTGINTK